MGLFRLAAMAVAIALTFATPVRAESSLGAATTPPPPESAPVPAYQPLGPGSSILQPSLETAADIDAFLARTPLAGRGSEFVQAEAATGVNARFLVGITWTENNSGASYLAQTQHNLFSITGSGPGGFVAYPSFEVSIQSAAVYLGSEYARPGGAHYRGGTIAAVGSVYAADPAWPEKVARAANFIGPSRASAFAAAIHVAAFGPSPMTLHVTNQGYMPWDLVPGAQLLLHYRWARHAESVTGVVALPAPAIRSAGQADIQVPGILAPDGAGWRLEVTAELTGVTWAEELGSGARDVQQLSSDDSAASTDLGTRDRLPAR
jgi:hypothetical protein